MKIEIKYSGSILNLPAKVVDLASRASENELRVILGIFGFLPYFDSFDSCLSTLASKLELDVNEVICAIDFWAKNGVIAVDGLDTSALETASLESSEKNTMPSYTGKQINEYVEKNKEIESLFASCQDVLGKTFNTHDFNCVIHLKTFYKFSDEFILILLAHCVEIDRANWAYIRKTAKNLYDEGIDTYEKLEKHFSARRNKRSREYKIRKLFGVGEREFTKRERDVFERWIGSKIPYELIEKAYEVTIDNIGKASLSYTAKVLENWQENGIKTVEDAENSLVKYKKRLSMSSFDTDDFFEAALKRSNEEIKKGSKL
ncbi:MAG: DnaD domain protein [Clostridia bacterium]|nr:DnaD domain protein [Clostridia bacterium]